MFSVLLLPGAVRSFLPSLLGRLSLAIASLALVLAIQSATGSFTAAGAVSAVFGLANVLASPWRARALDRWGASRVLMLLGLVHAAGFAASAIMLDNGALPLLLVLGVIIGVTAPPFGAAMRVTWADVTEPGIQRSRALSLDATSDELVFVVGPVIAASVVTLVSGPAALGLIAVLNLLAAVGFASSRLVRSRAAAPRATGAAKPRRVITLPGFGRVLVVLFGVGVVLGTFEITAPAVAVAQHTEVASGWLLAALSAGSAAGGIIYGHLRWRARLGSRLFTCAIGIGVVTIASGFTAGLGLVAFTCGAALAGLFLAPALITGYLAADEVSPEHAKTEASAWVNTALNLGASIATATAGALVSGPGPALALLGAGLLAMVTAAVAPYRRLAVQNTSATADQDTDRLNPEENAR